MKKPLVLQSDFGTADGAVSAMYGVAYGVDPDIRISDLTHVKRITGIDAGCIPRRTCRDQH